MDENVNVAITATTDQLNSGLSSATDSVGRYTSFVQQQMAQIRAESAEADTVVVASAQNINNALSETATISGGVAREFGVLTSEALRGNFTRMEGSIVTLANRMGLMQDVFSATGLSIIALTASGALLIDWLIKGAEEASALNNAIIATGNYAGVTASSVEVMSNQLVGGVTTITTAKDALAQLVASGKFAADEMPVLGQATVDMAAVTGKSIKDVVSEFEKLQESPVEAATKLDSTLHFLSESTLNQAIALENAGDKADAFSTIISALADNLRTKAAQMVQDAGYVEQAITRWEQGFANIKNFVFDWGKPATELDQLNNAVLKYQQGLKDYQTAINAGASPQFLENAYNDLVKERTAVELLQGAYNAKNAAAADQGAAAAQTAQANADAAAFDKLSETLQKQVAVYGLGHVAAVQYQIDQKVAAESAGKTADEIEALRYRLTQQADAALTNAQALDQLVASHKRVAAESDNFVHTMQTLDSLFDQTSAKLDEGGAYGRAWASYIATIDKAINAEANFKGSEEEWEVVAAQANAVMDVANQELQKQNDIIDQSLVSAYDKLIDAGQRHLDSLKGVGQQEEIEAEYLKELATFTAAWTKAKGADIPVTDEWKQKIHDHAAEVVNDSDAIKQNQAIIQDWQNIATNAFDSAFQAIDKDIIEGGSVMKDLVNVAKTVVEQIIFEFEKLAIINPLLNQIFGLSGSSALPTSSLSSIGQGLSSLLGGGSGGLPSLGDFFSDEGSSGGGGLSIGGLSALGLIGGIGAGASEFSSAGGGIAGLAGGAAYGIGAYALSGALTAGISAAAAGGISAGLSAGFAAIPVVGWIGLAAMGVNMLTHGGLFGTGFKPYGSEMNLSVDETGADISAAIDEKGKKALFGGTKWKTVSSPVDQATQDSVAAFFEGLQNAANAEAQAFGESTGEIVTGTFHETFDKAGKMLTQVSTVAGQQYSESIQDFQNRILADTLLANMGDASAEAQTIAEQWQKSASDLLAGTQFLAQAELDITQGHGLIPQDTLTQLTSFVQGMEAQGETLIQTYARLSTEVTDVQSILTNLGLDTGKAGEALVTFDDAMVKAAGGLQNLNTLWNDYYNNFFSDSERQAMKLSQDQQSAHDLLTAIGQDPNETMAQFRANFTAMMSSLSPEDVVKWLQASEALAAFNKDMSAVTNTAQDQAQALMDSAQKAADGLKTLISSTNQLATQLFGSLSSQLQAQLDSFKGTDLFFFEQAMLQPQIDAAKQQEAAASHLGDATTLLNDFAQIGIVSGQSLGDLAKEFHTPLDQLAKMLGTDSGGLQAMFAQDEANAAAALTTADNSKLQVEYLADIKALLQGGSLPYSVADFAGAISGTNAAVPGTRPSHGGFSPPSTGSEVADAVNTQTVVQQNNTDTLAELLKNIEQAINLLSARAGSSMPPQQRVARTTFFGAA